MKIGRAQRNNSPMSTLGESLPNLDVATKAFADVDGSAVHIHRDRCAPDHEVGNGDRVRGTVRPHWHLRVDFDAVLLEHLKESQFERRADARGVSLPPYFQRVLIGSKWSGCLGR